MYKVTDHPTRVPSAQVTEDGRYLVIVQFEGYESNAVYVQDLRKPGATPQPLFTAWDAIYQFIGPDEYVVVYALGGKDRPTELDSKPGSGHTMHVWRRVKSP